MGTVAEKRAGQEQDCDVEATSADRFSLDDGG